MKTIIVLSFAFLLTSCATKTETTVDAKGVQHVTKTEAADIPVITTIGNMLSGFVGIFVTPKPAATN